MSTMSSKMLNLSTSLQIQLDCHCSCIIICLIKSLSRRRKVIPDIFLLFPMFDLFIISLIQMSLQESFKAIYLCGFMWIQCRRLCGYSVGTQKMLVELIKKKKSNIWESSLPPHRSQRTEIHHVWGHQRGAVLCPQWFGTGKEKIQFLGLGGSSP